MISFQKSNIFKKINFQNILIIYILFQPIIDIITSLCVRNISEKLSLGIVIRVLFMLFIMIYAIIKTNTKSRIKLIIYYSCIALYGITYIANSYLKYNFSMIFTQVKGIVKVFYFPILLISLYEIYKEKKFNSFEKYLNISLIIYITTIIICRIFSVGYPTYPNNDKLGSIGLFYAGNETSAILAILTPICFWKLLTKKFSIFNTIVCVATVFSMLEIGTKVSVLSIFTLLGLSFILAGIKLFTKERKTIFKQFTAVSLMIVLVFVFVAYTPAGKNMNIGITWEKSDYVQSPFHSTPEKPENTEETEKDKKLYSEKLLSGRTDYLKDTLQRYTQETVLTKLTGIGYISLSNEKSVYENKLVEIDYFDIFFCHGILGTLIYIVPLIFIAISLFKKFFSNFVVNIKNYYTIFALYSILIGCGTALLAGHVFTAPAVSIFLVISILELFNTLKSKEDLVNE